MTLGFHRASSRVLVVEKATHGSGKWLMTLLMLCVHNKPTRLVHIPVILDELRIAERSRSCADWVGTSSLATDHQVPRVGMIFGNVCIK